MSVWGRFRDDRMIGGRLLTASLILTAAYAASASAQSPVAPALVRPAPIPATGAVVGELTATAPRTPDGKPYGCYSIDTTAGSRWTVTMSSTASAEAMGDRPGRVTVHCRTKTRACANATAMVVCAPADQGCAGKASPLGQPRRSFPQVPCTCS